MIKREKLVKSALKVFSADSDSIREYNQKYSVFLAAMNEAMLERKDILELVGGETNLQIMKDNHANHLRFIASILAEPDAETLVDVVIWVFRSYSCRGFSPIYWVAQLNTWMFVLENILTEKTFSQIKPIYVWMCTNIPSFTALSKEDHE